MSLYQQIYRKYPGQDTAWPAWRRGGLGFNKRDKKINGLDIIKAIGGVFFLKKIFIHKL